MSKEQIKIRKQWLIDPTTKVEKRRPRVEEDETDYSQMVGNVKDLGLEDEEEDDGYEELFLDDLKPSEEKL